MLFTIILCFASLVCHGFEWDLSLFHGFFCSFISSSLLLFTRSDMQYYCIISNSLVTVFDLCRDMYSPHRPRSIPFTTESMMLWSATFGPLARSFMRALRLGNSWATRSGAGSMTICFLGGYLHTIAGPGLAAQGRVPSPCMRCLLLMLLWWLRT